MFKIGDIIKFGSGQVSIVESIGQKLDIDNMYYNLIIIKKANLSQYTYHSFSLNWFKPQYVKVIKSNKLTKLLYQ